MVLKPIMKFHKFVWLLMRSSKTLVHLENKIESGIFWQCLVVCSKWKRITRVTTPMKNFRQGLIFSSHHASLKLTSTFDGKSVSRSVVFFTFPLLKNLLYASNLGFGGGAVCRSVMPFVFSMWSYLCLLSAQAKQRFRLAVKFWRGPSGVSQTPTIWVRRSQTAG